MADAATPDTTPPAWSWFTIAMLAVGAITVFRLGVLFAADYDLFFDEAQYWFWSRDLAAGYFSKPPVIALVIAATTGLCGDGEACIRAGAPILYGVVAVLSGLLARRMAGPFAGAAAALVMVSMPGTSFGARLISTDAPLLVFWTASLLVYHRYLQHRSLHLALLLGVLVGLGLMAKYAMVYFGFCLAVHALVERTVIARLTDGRLWAGFGVSLAIFLPNILWNIENGGVTLAHTADNARWSALDLHFDNFFEFLGAQAGIIGPVVTAAIALGLWQRGRRLGGDMRMMLAFSVPITATMALQALISRANANWAALSFPAYVVLGALVLAGWGSGRRWLFAALASHLAVFGALSVIDMNVRSWSRALDRSPFHRVLGWSDAIAQIGVVARTHQAGAIVSNSRSVIAQLNYYLRGDSVPIMAWLYPNSPRNHYELVTPASPETPGPILFVSRCNLDFTGLLSGTRDTGMVSVPISKARRRTLYWALVDKVPADPPHLADCRS